MYPFGLTADVRIKINNSQICSSYDIDFKNIWAIPFQTNFLIHMMLTLL